MKVQLAGSFSSFNFAHYLYRTFDLPVPVAPRIAMSGKRGGLPDMIERLTSRESMTDIHIARFRKEESCKQMNLDV